MQRAGLRGAPLLHISLIHTPVYYVWQGIALSEHKVDWEEHAPVPPFWFDKDTWVSSPVVLLIFSRPSSFNSLTPREGNATLERNSKVLSPYFVHLIRRSKRMKQTSQRARKREQQFTMRYSLGSIRKKSHAQISFLSLILVRYHRKIKFVQVLVVSTRTPRRTCCVVASAVYTYTEHA